MQVTIMKLGWTGSYENMHIAHWAASNFTVKNHDIRALYAAADAAEQKGLPDLRRALWEYDTAIRTGTMSTWDSVVEVVRAWEILEGYRIPEPQTRGHCW